MTMKLAGILKACENSEALKHDTCAVISSHQSCIVWAGGAESVTPYFAITITYPPTRYWERLRQQILAFRNGGLPALHKISNLW